MGPVEKARVRLEHWISHNDHHLEEYEMFAQELDGAGRAESARCVREMMQHALRGNECLRAALHHLVTR